MPKRKAATAAPASFTGLIGSDDEDPMMQIPETQEPRDVERPTKKQRGRPRSKSGEGKPPPVQTKRSSVAAAAPEEPEPVSTRRTTRRGRPKGSRNSSQAVPDEIPGTQVAPDGAADDGKHPPTESAVVSQGELDASQKGAQASSRSAAAPAKAKSGRGRRKASSGKQVTVDGEFEYTPAGTRQVKLPDPRKETEEKPKRSRRAPAKTVQEVPAEEVEAAPEIVEETMIEEEEEEEEDHVPPPRRSVSASPTKRRQSMQRLPSYSSPLKRKVGTDEERSNGDPELRRRLGDLTKKFDALENRYRTLKEIGVVEANANVDKLRKQCEAISTGMFTDQTLRSKPAMSFDSSSSRD